MPAFVHYWDIETVRSLRTHESEPLNFTNAHHLRSSEIRLGDYLYVVCVAPPSVFLIGRMIVDRFDAPTIDRGTFSKALPTGDVEVFCLQGTPMRLDRVISESVVRQVYLDESIGTSIEVPDLIHGVVVRGFRRLALDSAMLLDNVIDNEG